jgi:hypothetical protein
MILVPLKSNGIVFRWKKPVGKPSGRWEDAVWRDAVDLFQIRNWQAAARKM